MPIILGDVVSPPKSPANSILFKLLIILDNASNLPFTVELRPPGFTPNSFSIAKIASRNLFITAGETGVLLLTEGNEI